MVSPFLSSRIDEHDEPPQGGLPVPVPVGARIMRDVETESILPPGPGGTTQMLSASRILVEQFMKGWSCAVCRRRSRHHGSETWNLKQAFEPRGFGWRIHCGVEVTVSSTNKQHTLSVRRSLRVGTLQKPNLFAA